MDRIRDLECGIRRAKSENEVWKSRFIDLQTELLRIKQVEFQKLELEKACGVLQANYYRLSSEFRDKKKECDGIQSELDDLILRKVYVQNELKEYKRTTSELKEQILRIEEDRNVIFQSEKRAQERITYLEEENVKMVSERDKYVEVETENRQLKRRAEGEIEVWKKRVRELETQEASRMKHEVELEKELDLYRNKCNGLSLELEEKKMAGVAIEDKLKDIMLRKIAVDDELKECETMCNFQKEKITLLEEDKNILRGSEKRAQERITCLSMELKKRESGESEKGAQLKTENKNLEIGKSRTENGVDGWKKRFRELETQVLRLNQVELKKSELEKELEACKTQCHGLNVELEEKKMEGAVVEGKLKDLELRKIVVDDELKEYKTTCNEMKELIMGLEEDQNVISGKDKTAHERIAYLEEKIRKMEMHCRTDGAHEKMSSDSSFAGCYNPSSLQGIKHVVQIAGPLSINMQSEPLVNAMEEKKNTPLDSNSDFGAGTRKQLFFELERSSSEKLDVLEEEDSAPKHTCNIRGKQISQQKVHVSTDNTLKRSSDNKKKFTSNKCLKRPCSDRRGEEFRSSYKDDFLWSSIPKRRRSSKTVTDESESEDEDRIPISKRKRKKLEELNEGVHKLSPSNLCARAVTQSSGGQNVEKSISPSGRRLISLKQCEEKKNWTERTFSNESTSPNFLQISEIFSHQKAAGNPTFENGKENVVENVGLPTLPSEGESLGGIIVNWSGSLDRGGTSSDSEDARDIVLLLSRIITMVKRNRLKESNWESEADMLSSFDEDSELCMKAVCALYRQQISKKQLVMGFDKYDELRIATLAKFLMDEDPEGDLKKSMKELEVYPKAPEECKRLAKHYSKQLFRIYQNKEDLFFLPNSSGTPDQTANSGRM